MPQIYNSEWSGNAAPGSSLTQDFELESTNRELKIKSITIFHKIRFGNLIIPNDNNTDLQIGFSIGTPNIQIGKDFDQIGANLPSRNGSGFTIFNVGQFVFDSFFIMNRLPIQLSIINLHAANTYNYVLSISIEAEEKILYI